jgi:membrane peptidoglycan carboxypeptidase
VNTGNRCTPNAIKPGVANTLADMMLGVVNGGTGRKAQIPGHDIAGKTGTTQENATAAFVGITPTFAVSVLLFDPKGEVKVGGHGGGTPAVIFHDALAPLLASQPNVPFPGPDPAVAAGTKGSGYIAPAPKPKPAPTPDQPTTQQPPAGPAVPPPGPTDPGTNDPANGDPADPFGGGNPFGN